MFNENSEKLSLGKSSDLIDDQIISSYNEIYSLIRYFQNLRLFVFSFVNVIIHFYSVAWKAKIRIHLKSKKLQAVKKKRKLTSRTKYDLKLKFFICNCVIVFVKLQFVKLLDVSDSEKNLIRCDCSSRG